MVAKTLFVKKGGGQEEGDCAPISSKWAYYYRMTVSIALSLFPIISFSASGIAIPEDKIQTCLTPEGTSFKCYFDHGVCFTATPTDASSDEKQRYLLKPCKGAPMVLSKAQQSRIEQTQKSQEDLLSDCRDLKKKYIAGELSKKPTPDAGSLEPLLWKLVSCLRTEADTEYDTKNESELYRRLTHILELLTKYPTSTQKAYHELGDIYEGYFTEYDKALRAYEHAFPTEDAYRHLALGRVSCLNSKDSKSKAGLENYIKAIEANVFQIDVDNTNTRYMSLNTLLEQCGYKHLIPIIEAEKNLYTTPETKDPGKTIAFIKQNY